MAFTVSLSNFAYRWRSRSILGSFSITDESPLSANTSSESLETLISLHLTPPINKVDWFSLKISETDYIYILRAKLLTV